MRTTFEDEPALQPALEDRLDLNQETPSLVVIDFSEVMPEGGGDQQYLQQHFGIDIGEETFPIRSSAIRVRTSRDYTLVDFFQPAPTNDAEREARAGMIDRSERFRYWTYAGMAVSTLKLTREEADRLSVWTLEYPGQSA